MDATNTNNVSIEPVGRTCSNCQEVSEFGRIVDGDFICDDCLHTFVEPYIDPAGAHEYEQFLKHEIENGTMHECDICRQVKTDGEYVDNDNLWICSECMDEAEPDEGSCEGCYEELARQEQEAFHRREEQAWCRLNNVDSDQGHELEPDDIDHIDGDGVLVETDSFDDIPF